MTIINTLPFIDVPNTNGSATGFGETLKKVIAVIASNTVLAFALR